MAKKRDKKNVRQIGKQPPRYRFFLNPYLDARFSSCPACANKTKQRTLPLLMYIEPNRPLFMNTVCRYCPYCDLLIAHQDELEDALATVFTVLDPEIVGNKYVVIGTLDRADWKRIDQNNLPFQDTLEALHDFKDEVTFEPAGGWRRR